MVIAKRKRPTASRPNLTTPPQPRLLGQPLAAAYLGIGERLFEKCWRNYQLPQPIRIGRRCVWDIKRLNEWADAASGYESVSSEEEDDDWVC